MPAKDGGGTDDTKEVGKLIVGRAGEGEMKIVRNERSTLKLIRRPPELSSSSALIQGQGVCKSYQAGPRQGHAVLLSKSRNIFLTTRYKLLPDNH